MSIYGVVYKITNKFNEKVYIGQTNNFKRRKWEHNNMFNKGYHENIFLQGDLIKYGKEAFSIEIIKECFSRQELIDEETRYINKYGDINSENTYNMQDKTTANDLMRTLNSNGQKGKRLSEEHKKHISITEKNYYANGSHKPTFKDKHHTQKTKKLLSEKHKGTHLSEETKLKISKANKGKCVSNETRKKMQEAQLGRRKYNDNLIEVLREEYASLKSYTKVHKNHSNINYYSMINLIKYGNPNHPSKSR